MNVDSRRCHCNAGFYGVLCIADRRSNHHIFHSNLEWVYSKVLFLRLHLLFQKRRVKTKWRGKFVEALKNWTKKLVRQKKELKRWSKRIRWTRRPVHKKGFCHIVQLVMLILMILSTIRITHLKIYTGLISRNWNNTWLFPVPSKTW